MKHFNDIVHVCSEGEVCKLLSSLDVSKTTGPDGISARVLKATADCIAPSVTKLFHLSLQTGCVIHEWKQSVVVPFHKTSPATSPNNYRPISLLTVLSKALECCVHATCIIVDHLQTSCPLATSQWVFLIRQINHDWIAFNYP